MKCIFLAALFALLTACTQSVNLPLEPQSFSTNKNDIAYDVTANSTGVFVAGSTTGSLERSNPNQGWDPFIRKYNPTYIWGNQFGPTTLTSPDYGYDVAVDSQDNSYIAGDTFNALGGPNPEQQRDAYVRKYSPTGTALWTKQFGDLRLSNEADVAVDQGDNVYLASYETDGVVRKLSSSNGSVLLTITIPPSATGGEFSFPHALDIDSQGNIYVLVITFVTEQLDTYILRYDSSGTLTKKRRVVATEQNEYPTDLKVDSQDNVIVSVGSNTINTGPLYGYLSKYKGSDLSKLWSRRMNPALVNGSNFAVIESVATDGTDIYIAGAVSGRFPGASSSGVADAFVMKYDAFGSRLWVNQFGSTAINDPFLLGTNGVDRAYGVAVSDEVYVVGSTTGKLLSSTAKPARDEDAFIAQLDKTTGVIHWLDQ
jgi:Beta-propeller repeat